MFKFLKPPAHKPLLPEDKIDSTYKRYRLQVFIGIFLGYAGYYLIRKNFALAMPDLEAQGFSHTSLGFALSAVSLAYGISKFVMGGISDRSNARIFLSLGLALSAILMIMMGLIPFFTSSIMVMYVILFINGWFQGMGWPPCGRVMAHWFSTRERGSKMAVWNTAHNVGGALVGPVAILGVALFTDFHSKLYFPAMVALLFAAIAYILVRDTPQSCGLPNIEEYRHDYPADYNKNFEEEMSLKEILFKHVFNNKMLWMIAFANIFIYLVRYGIFDWVPTYFKAQGLSITDSGMAWTTFELAGIPGTLVCGWMSDKIFKGRRAPATIIYMALTLIAVIAFWKNTTGSMLVYNIALFAIGFLIYGPVMLIGVQAIDLVPKKAAGTAAGLTGFLGYFVGTALLANIGIGYIVDHFSWDHVFVLLIISCILAMILSAATWNTEKRRLGEK